MQLPVLAEPCFWPAHTIPHLSGKPVFFARVIPRLSPWKMLAGKGLLFQVPGTAQCSGVEEARRALVLWDMGSSQVKFLTKALF